MLNVLISYGDIASRRYGTPLNRTSYDVCGR